MKRQSRRAETQVHTQEKRVAALKLRINGSTFAAIGETLGMTRQGATKLVEQAIADIPKEPAEALRKLELARCDALHEALWPKAATGDIASTDAVLRVMARRAKLSGLDAPSAVIAKAHMVGDGATATTTAIVVLPPLEE